MQKNQVAYIGLNNLFGRIVTSLLKQSPNISKLVLYDDKNGGTVQSYTNGTDEESNVTTIYGRERLPSALTKADIVVIGDELFQTPSPDSIKSIGYKAAEYARLIAAFSPNAILVIAAYPLNYVLPIFASVLEAAGCFDPRRLLGATSCDTLRASTLLSSRLRLSPQKTILPVIGGASSKTRIPLFSQANSPIEIDQDTKLDVVDKLKLFDGTEYSEADVIERAYASVRFTHSVLAARTGFSPIPEIALTRNEDIPNVEYFSMPLLIGKDGVEKIMKLPKLSPFESNMLQSAIECLNSDISASKKLMNEKNISDDVQDLGVQLRLIEDNEEQISKKQYDIKNQELQDKPKDFVELDSVLTGVSDRVRNDVYADTVKNEENVKINLPTMEEIHKVTTTFVMPHDKYSKELSAKTPPVRSPNMDEKAEDVALMINNISKNNGLPFNKVTLSQVKKDICTKTEVFPDNLTYRRTGLGKYAHKEMKSPKSFIIKPTPPTKRVYNYLKKAKKTKANFPPEKSIMKKDIQVEGSFLKEVPRKLPLPVKLKINKTGAKLAEPEKKIYEPLQSFNVPVRENDELEDTIYLSDVPKLAIAENPDTYVDLTSPKKSLVPFEDKNETNIVVDTSTIESDFDKLQNDYDQFNINAREVGENANKQMFKNQGIIDEKLVTSQNPEDQLNVLEVRDIAKRFAKLEQAIQKVLNMSQKPALDDGKIEPKNTENILSATENETSNMPESQMELTTQNRNLVSPQERQMLDIPAHLENVQNATVHQESPINLLEGQFFKAPEVSTDENTKTELKVADQFDMSQQKLPETEFVYKQSMGFAPIQQKVPETEVEQRSMDFTPIQEETAEICTAEQMVNQNKFAEAIEESQEVNDQNTIFISQESPKFPNIEIHKRKQVVINENTNQEEPPTKVEDNLNLSTTEDQPKTDQLLNSQQESLNFSQFETALDQIIETAPSNLPEATIKLEENKPQVLNIKEKTIIKLQELNNKPKPQTKKFEFFKELHERFELEKRLSVNMIKNTKIKTIPEYVQNVREPKISDLKSPSLSNKLNEDLEKNEEEVPDSFLLFKKAFDHVLSTSSKSCVNLEDNNKEFQNNARHIDQVLNTEEKSSVNLIDKSKEESQNNSPSSSKAIKKEVTKMPDISENIENEITALVNKLKKNKDVGEADKILRKLYSELSEEIKTKKISSIDTDNTNEKSIKSIKTPISLSLPKQELKTKGMLHVKSLEKVINKQIELKDSEIPSDYKGKVTLGLEDLMINIKKNNLEVANKKQSEKIKDGKLKIILAPKSKLKEKIINENEVKADKINLASDDQPKEITRIEVEADKIYLGSNTQSKELDSIEVKADNLESDAQLKESAVLDDTKLVKNEINLSSTSNMNPNELCINPFGPWCKETNLSDLNIPISEFKMAKKAVKIDKEENVEKPEETKKEILLTINPTVVQFVKEDSLKIIKEDETIFETASTSKTNEYKSESLKTKIAFHRKRRRPKAVAMLRCLDRNNDEKYKIVKVEVKRNRLKSKPMIKPKMVKTEELKDVDEIKVEKVVLPKTDFVLKASQKISEARSKSRRNIIIENKLSDPSNMQIVRSLRAKQILINKDLKIDESNKLSGDNPVNKFLAKAMAKKKLKEAAALNLKVNSRKKKTHVEVKDSVKPYGFSLPSEKKSGYPKSEKIIAEKKASMYTNKVVNIQTNSNKSENNENNIKISLISAAKTEKPDISIMKKVEPIVFKKIELKKSGDQKIDGEKMKKVEKIVFNKIEQKKSGDQKMEGEKMAFNIIEPKKSGDQKMDGGKIKMKEKIAFNKIEPKKTGNQKIEKEKMKNDNLNLKVLNDPFSKNEKNETEICLVGSGTPFPDWSPIADDFIPITGEINPPSGSMGMKTEIDTKLIVEMPEKKRPFDLAIAPQSLESTEQKKIVPINSNSESKLSTIKLELESTKAAVKAHNLNAKPQLEKKIGSRLNSFIVRETKNNTLKATSNKVRENLVSKAKLNEKSNIMKKSISNEAKVVKSASMLALREAHMKLRDFPTPKSSKSLANLTAGLKQAVYNLESTSMTPRNTKSKSNLHLGTKGNFKHSKSNKKISGVKIPSKSETSIKKGFSIKKREDIVRITSSEKLLKSKKYEYNIGKIKGGIKKLVAEDAYKSKHIHTQSDLQAKQGDKFNKENTIKGIIDLRNKQRYESPSDHSSVTDIAQKSLNESLKNAILLNAKEATKEVFANRKIDITKTEEKLITKQEKKDNPILKNKEAPTPVFKKPVIKPRVETTTEKKPMPENLADSVSFLDNNEGKPRLPIIKPPEPLRAPFPSELNTVPERKLKSINFEAHVQNLMKKQAQDAERKQEQDVERKQARDVERKQARDAERKHAQDAKRKQAQDEERKQAQDAERKQAYDTERKNSVEETSNNSDMPDKNTRVRHPLIQKIERNSAKNPIGSTRQKHNPERHPFIQKNEPIIANETTPLQAPGENTRKSNMIERNTPEKHIKKIEPNTPKKKPPNPDYKAIDRKPSRSQELLNTAFEIRPSSISVHGLLPQKNPRPGKMLLRPRSPPPQMKLSTEKNDGNKRNDIDYFKDFNDPYMHLMKPIKNHSKLTEMKFMHENIQKHNSIYQNLSNSSHEKLIAAQMPTSLKSAPHPIVPKKPVQQPTKKNVAAQFQESPKPIVREKRENTKPVRLIKPDITDVQPLGNPNTVTATKPETSASESKKDGWGKLFNIFKQIISRDLEEEQVERLRTESTSTSTK